MKDLGIVRNVDPLGRIVIPKEIRNRFGLHEGTPVGFYIEGDFIGLKKTFNACCCCGSPSDVDLDDTRICLSCVEKIKKLNTSVR